MQTITHLAPPWDLGPSLGVTYSCSPTDNSSAHRASGTLQKAYRNTHANAVFNPPLSCNGGAETSPLLHDPELTAIAFWQMCNPVQGRLLPDGDGSSHLLFQSFIFNSNNVMGIIMRPMKERNILIPQTYTPPTASISFCSLFFLHSAIARHISFSFPCLPHQAHHRYYFLAFSPVFSFCKF